MINNIENEKVRQKVDSEISENDAVRTIYELVNQVIRPYGINPDAGGLEFTSTTEIRGFPNRCRIKIWQPEENKLMAWFYKPSAVHFSRDRYSLGGVVWDLREIDLGKVREEVDEWLAWLDSGLDPGTRPRNWLSAFPYDIPN